MAKQHKLHFFITYPKTGGQPWYSKTEHDLLITNGKFSNAIVDTQFKQLIPVNSDSITHAFKGGEEVPIGDVFGVQDYVINKPDDASGSILIASITADAIYRLQAKNPLMTAPADIAAAYAYGKGSYEGASRKLNAVGLYIYCRTFDLDNNSDDPIGISGTGATKTFVTDPAALPTKLDAWFYPLVIFERNQEYKTQDNVRVVEMKFKAIPFDGDTKKNILWFDGPLYKAAV